MKYCEKNCEKNNPKKKNGKTFHRIIMSDLKQIVSL